MDVGWPRGGRARAAELYSVWLRLMSERKREGAKRGRLTSVCSTNERERMNEQTPLFLYTTPASLARSIARCHATAGSPSRRRRRRSLTRGAGPSIRPPSFPGMLPLPMRLTLAWNQLVVRVRRSAAAVGREQRALVHPETGRSSKTVRASAWAKTGGAAAAATATEEEFSSFALYINCR